MSRVSNKNVAVATGFGQEHPETLSAPLLQGEDYEEDESRAQSDDDTDSYADRQNSVSPRQTRESRRSNSPPLLIHLNSSDKRGATADYGRDNNAVGGMGGGGRGRVVGIQRKVSVKIRRSVGSSRASSPEPSGEAVAHTASSPRDTHDYRSEGEQPSTARDGARRRADLDYDMARRIRRGFMKQDSFRAARMPKRGGRKRLRRIGSVRRKIRVSSYCVARELNTLKLLRWLESQPNRRLSQNLRAQGAAMPQGLDAGNSRVSPRAIFSGVRDAAAAVVAEGGVVPAAGRTTGSMAGRKAGSRIGAAEDLAPTGPSPQVEWMDSLYIDVIHSTTDLRGGLRKARDLARPAVLDMTINERQGYDGYGSTYYDERDDDSRDGRRGRDGEDGRGEAGGRRDEDDDDDELTHKDVMFFPYGAVVFWGCSEAEEREMLSGLKRFIVGKVSDNELAESFDDMMFVYRPRDSGRSVPLKNDEITLDTRDPAEKLAYSCALAQSAKLFVFEERLDGTIESTAKYPQMLAATGKIPINEVQIGKLVGKVLCEQNEVNLHSDILDTPEYFWEDDAWEPAYQALCAYLDIPLRVDNLNKRLDILRELLDVLSTQSTNAHATRLEVIIIYLIFVEVAIELVWNVIIKDIFHLVSDDRY